MIAVPERLETQRLYLRKPQKTDAAAIFNQYAQDEKVTEFLLWPPHKSLSDTRTFLRKSIRDWDRGLMYAWAVIRRADHKFLGMASVVSIDQHGAMIGYVLDRAFWGMGYMSEAVRKVVEWIAVQDGIDRVWAFCDVENGASVRVLEKAGMEREGVLRNWIRLPNRGNELRDCYCYALVPEKTV